MTKNNTVCSLEIEAIVSALFKGRLVTKLIHITILTIYKRKSGYEGAFVLRNGSGRFKWSVKYIASDMLSKARLKKQKSGAQKIKIAGNCDFITFSMTWFGFFCMPMMTILSRLC